MNFVDTHAHIYLEEFDEDRKEIFACLAKKSIDRVFMPNIDSSTISRVHQVEEEFPSQAFAMMGLHPCYVKENYLEELNAIEKQLRDRKYAGLGEVGVDLYWDKSTIVEQKLAFRKQIEWAKDLNLPVIIHSRDSLDITIDIISEMQEGNLTGIFHCFNGSVEQAKRIAGTGFLMGIGGVVTFKKAGVDETVSQLSLENLVLETDAPYLSPTPYRGKRNSPEYIPIIARKISEVLDVDIEEVAKRTTENADRLFSSYLDHE